MKNKDTLNRADVRLMIARREEMLRKKLSRQERRELREELEVLYRLLGEVGE